MFPEITNLRIYIMLKTENQEKYYTSSTTTKVRKTLGTIQE